MTGADARPRRGPDAGVTVGVGGADRDREGPAEPYGVQAIRTLLLGVVVLGILGLGAELVLLEHWESPLQWTPLLALAAATPVVVRAGLRPGPRSIRVLRVVMVAFLVIGAVGLFLHGRSNALLELEMNPSSSGWRLVRRVLFGGTPLLAPGALAQLGLVGLVATFRHPDAGRR